MSRAPLSPSRASLRKEKSKLKDDTGVVWSVCYVWPSGKGWDEVNEGGGLTPKGYAECMVSFLSERRRRSGGKDRFLVCVDRSLPEAIKSAFRNAGGDDVLRMCELDCEREGDFLPTLERLRPVFEPSDLTQGRLVVACDVHDCMEVQDSLLEKLLGEEGTKDCLLTFWPAEGDECVSNALRSISHPLPVLPSARGRKEGYHWHFDAGMVATTERFRKRLHARLAYGDFVRRFLGEYRMERSAEEVVAEAYLSASLFPEGCAEECDRTHHSLLLASSCSLFVHECEGAREGEGTHFLTQVERNGGVRGRKQSTEDDERRKSLFLEAEVQRQFRGRRLFFRVPAKKV